jgi:hypothetical protein
LQTLPGKLFPIGKEIAVAVDEGNVRVALVVFRGRGGGGGGRLLPRDFVLLFFFFFEAHDFKTRRKRGRRREKE